MKDYFKDVKEYLKRNYKLTVKKEKCENLDINNVLKNYHLNENTKYIYENYQAFDVVWYDIDNKYIGAIIFVSISDLDSEHEELIGIMEECYDVDADELNIVEDINHWYPLFYFPNGDAFCLDMRNGTVVFYEHEVFEGEKNLHGLLIATSINDLFEKWSSFHFADIYDWSEVVNDEGIDLECEMLREYRK